LLPLAIKRQLGFVFEIFFWVLSERKVVVRGASTMPGNLKNEK
jgi:hypothetical protein